jgi:hypothetical protein
MRWDHSFRRFRIPAVLGLLVGSGLAWSVISAPVHADGGGVGYDSYNRIVPTGVVNLAALATGPTAGPRTSLLKLVNRVQQAAPNVTPAASPAVLGGAKAPASQVASGGDKSNFNGISSIDQETGGTGKYAATNGTLEPPDQGLCTGAGYVMETVNDALRVYTTAGVATTTNSVPLSQFFKRSPSSSPALLTDFISDPRCIFDSATQRWFVTMLDLSQPVDAQYVDDKNFIAVSKTSNPTGDWYIYSFDVTDNGLHGTPLHPGCIGAPLGTLAGCLGDQPTIGADKNGIYITDNEYAFAEVFPVSPPVLPPFQQIPVLRSGTAQLYALSKQQLISGTDTTLVRFDSNSIPFLGPAEDSPWQSISPARAVPGDATPTPANGVEYFLSDVGLPVGHNANQIVVWAWTNTASLSSAMPKLTLQHKIVNTASTSDTFFAPDPSFPASQPFAAYQKDGPHPVAAAGGDPEEYLNANDDRMSWVTLSNGSLWTALNTLLPATKPGVAGHAGENRVGIMYFKVIPSMTGGTLTVKSLRDGYVQVPNNNVLYGSIGPRADGATVMTFTLAGIDNFPSVAWTRLDGVSSTTGPVVHVARVGAAPQDGFSGVGQLGQQGLPDLPPCGPCVSRWGDYSATQVADNGCIWGAAEYIPTGKHDAFGQTDWGTGIYSVCPPRVDP